MSQTGVPSPFIVGNTSSTIVRLDSNSSQWQRVFPMPSGKEVRPKFSMKIVTETATKTPINSQNHVVLTKPDSRELLPPGNRSVKKNINFMNYEAEIIRTPDMPASVKRLLIHEMGMPPVYLPTKRQLKKKYGKNYDSPLDEKRLSTQVKIKRPAYEARTERLMSNYRSVLSMLSHSSTTVTTAVNTEANSKTWPDAKNKGYEFKDNPKISSQPKETPSKDRLRPPGSAFIGPLLSQQLCVRRNEVLLNIWSDTGCLSKIDAMTIACSVMESGHDDFEKPLDMQKKDEFRIFCTSLNQALGFHSNNTFQFAKNISSRDYRVIWRVYGIFSQATKTGVTMGKPDKDAITKKTGRVSKLASKYKSIHAAMCQHEEFIYKFNPTMSQALSHPLKIFLVTYGRFVQLEKVASCLLLKDNALNSHIHKYHSHFSSSVPGTYLCLPNHLEMQLTNSSSNLNKLHEHKLSYLDSKIFNEALAINSGLGQESSDLPVEPDNKALMLKLQDELALPVKPKKKNLVRKICVFLCRYDIVKRLSAETGFKFVGEKDEWNILWSDGPLTVDKIADLLRNRLEKDAKKAIQETDSTATGQLQKLNHFPGMNEICRKDRLARNLQRMQKHFTREYDFFPETWTLPADLGEVMYYARMKKDCTFICKPELGAQGKGIFLVRDLKVVNPNLEMICQLYIPRPFLIDGYKFDLRIYALVTCCDPFRIYLYNEGIARFATVKYTKPDDDNIGQTYMHLTNYSINKYTESINPPECKRKLSQIYKWLLKQGHNIEKIVTNIDSIVVKTLISAQSAIRHYYRFSFPRRDAGSYCFELLGFDILLDEKLKPYLLEVNHSPSFNVDLNVDEDIKNELLKDTFSKIYVGSYSDRLNRGKSRSSSGTPAHMFNMKDPSGALLTPTLQKQFRHESLHASKWRLIYPDSSKARMYKRFLNQANLDSMTDLTKHEDAN